MEDQPDGQVTCWTLIRAAASGNKRDRSEFAHRYLPVVRSCLQARWKRSPLQQLVEDAVQEVFLECFRQEGVLDKAGVNRPKKFHAFLLGVVRNVALRVERRWARREARRDPETFHPDEMPSREERLSKLFDRAWAMAMIQQAGELQQRRASRGDAAAKRRVEVLRLCFEEELPIREIAARWGEDPKSVHGLYRTARQEYRDCLREVVAFHHPDTAEDHEEEYQRLLSLIG